MEPHGRMFQCSRSWGSSSSVAGMPVSPNRSSYFALHNVVGSFLWHVADLPFVPNPQHDAIDLNKSIFGHCQSPCGLRGSFFLYRTTHVHSILRVNASTHQHVPSIGMQPIPSLSPSASIRPIFWSTISESIFALRIDPTIDHRPFMDYLSPGTIVILGIIKCCWDRPIY